MSNFTDYTQYDGLGLAELVRTGQVTPLELVEAAIARIEQLNPQLNAVVYKLYDQARRAAQKPLPAGPFQGVPFLLKDLLSALAGVPMSSGSRFLRNFVPPQDSELVRRYKAAGVIILGKTNTPEFGLLPYTEPALFGPTRNPWDVSRTSGGSSGGAATAVAAGMVPLAGGGDGGGSIRIPASCCGLFGLKPTRGRTPIGPFMAEAWEGLVVEHVLTRSVRDSAAMLDAIAGADVGALYAPAAAERPFLSEVTTTPGPLRIAYTSTPFMGRTVHEDCLQGLTATAHLLAGLGHEVEEAAPQVNGAELAVAFITMLTGQVRGDIEEAGRWLGRKPTAADFEPSTWGLGLLGKAIKAADYVTAVRTLKLAARQVGEFFQRYDLLLTPTLAAPPVPVGSLQPTPSEIRFFQAINQAGAGWLLKALDVVKPIAAKSFTFTPYTLLFNVTGQPAMSVPLHWNGAGLPIGMQFVGRYGDEATLFRLAGQLEQAQPWFNRTPPL